MNIELITIILFASMLLVLALGVPIAFGLGGIGIIFTIWLWGVGGLTAIPLKATSIITNVILTAVPLFIFMGMILERSGIGDDLFNMFSRILGGIRGGLAVASVSVCTIFAAMTGVSGAACVTLGIVALPQMLKHGYSKTLSIGGIMAGAALGVLIPPSVLMVIYSWVGGGTSVGRLFAGGILPGLLLAALFVIYIVIRARLRPNQAPLLSKEEQGTTAEKINSLKAVAGPIIVVLGVLGTMFAGIATPTEAAAVGCLAITLVALVQRRLTWKKFREASTETFRVNGLLLWIVLGATYFVTVYIAIGAKDLIINIMSALPLNKWLVVIGMQLILFVLGMFVETTGIVMITVPVFVPIIMALGFDPTWFGILFVMNMEMGFITPPFGINLFYMKGVAPKGVKLTDIYSSVWPFVACQGIGLALVMVFPQIALWIPNMIFGASI